MYRHCLTTLWVSHMNDSWVIDVWYCYLRAHDHELLNDIVKWRGNIQESLTRRVGMCHYGPCYHVKGFAWVTAMAFISESLSSTLNMERDTGHRKSFTWPVAEPGKNLCLIQAAVQIKWRASRLGYPILSNAMSCWKSGILELTIKT